jgi:hypothetical protein
MRDPAFIAERNSFHEDVTPMSAPQIEALLKELMATPKDLIDETRAIIAETGR